MFWFMLIGFVVGGVVTLVGLVLFGMKKANMSFEEFGNCGLMMIEAGNNRESSMHLCYNDELQNTLVFEEK